MARTQSRVVTTKVLEGVSSGLWDLKANLMGDIVEQHGSRRALKWFASNMPTYEKILKEWGPLRTHLIAVAVSSSNGCGYCAYGHGFAFQLHWFEITGTLFPLDEHQMQTLGASGAEAAQLTLDGALKSADVPEAVELRQWVDRAFVVTEGSVRTNPEDRDDLWLQHLIDMFGFLNACGINADTEPDGAHDPINKNLALQGAYAAARLSSRKRSAD